MKTEEVKLPLNKTDITWINNAKACVSKRETEEEIVLSRGVSPAMGRKAVIYAKCKAAAVIANCAQVFRSTKERS